MKTGGWEAVGADNSEAMDIDMEDDDENHKNKKTNRYYYKSRIINSVATL